jgi:hypothetical protein
MIHWPSCYALSCLLLVAVGYQAGSRDDANAGTTWQAEQFDSWASFWVFLNELPADCAVDWESTPDFRRYAVAYSCPD